MKNDNSGKSDMKTTIEHNTSTRLNCNQNHFLTCNFYIAYRHTHSQCHTKHIPVQASGSAHSIVGFRTLCLFFKSLVYRLLLVLLVFFLVTHKVHQNWAVVNHGQAHEHEN